MRPSTEAKLLVAGIGVATFVAGGSLGPSGLTGAFNSVTSFAQFAIAGGTTVLGAGLCAIAGTSLARKKYGSGMGGLYPGIISMVLGFFVGAAGGNLAGVKAAEFLSQNNAKPTAVQALHVPRPAA